MTTRERLHRLVDDLSEDKAAEALALLESQLADEHEPAALPEFFGMLHSAGEIWRPGLTRFSAPSSAAGDHC